MSDANYICPTCGSNDLEVMTATITVEKPLDSITGGFALPYQTNADDVWVRCCDCAEEADIKAFEEAAQEANA